MTMAIYESAAGLEGGRRVREEEVIPWHGFSIMVASSPAPAPAPFAVAAGAPRWLSSWLEEAADRLHKMVNVLLDGDVSIGVGVEVDVIVHFVSAMDWQKCCC